MATKKKPVSGESMAARIAVPIIVALVIGGSAPWWWEKLVREGSNQQPPSVPATSQTTSPPPAPATSPKECRDKSHGIEGYANTFETEQYSHWMAGGYSQDPWCKDVIPRLKGEHPDGDFKVFAKSEERRSTCFPRGCFEYRYYCKVRVNTGPTYFEKASPACK